jgi:hypothetical protein
VISFIRLSQLSLERGVYVSGPFTIEKMKRVLYTLKRRIGTYSKVMFLVSGILRRVVKTHIFLVEVDQKYTEETYNHIFERLILIDPEKTTFQSDEYVTETGYVLYAAIDNLHLKTGLEGSS